MNCCTSGFYRPTGQQSIYHPVPPWSLMILGHRSSISTPSGRLGHSLPSFRCLSLFEGEGSCLTPHQWNGLHPMYGSELEMTSTNDLTLWMSKSVRTVRLQWSTKDTHILKRNNLWSDRLYFWGTQGYTNYLTIREQHTSPTSTCLHLCKLQHSSWCLVAFWFISPDNLCLKWTYGQFHTCSLSCFSPMLLPPLLEANISTYFFLLGIVHFSPVPISFLFLIFTCMDAFILPAL